MAIVFAYNLICLLALATVTQLFLNGLDRMAFLFVTVLVTCQIFQMIVIGGLLGKSAIAGVGWSALLGFCTAVAVIPNAMYVGAYRDLLVLPFVICIVSAPLLLARFNWGWQLIGHPNDTIPFRRTAMEDFFVLTASVAAIIALLFDSSPRYMSRSATSIDPIGLMLMLILAAASVPIMGIVYLYFRRGLDGLATFLVLTGLYLPHHLFFGTVTQFSEQWMLFGAPLCAVGSMLTLGAYRLGGFRLVRFYDRLQRGPDELSQVESRYIAESRRSAEYR